MFFFSILLNIWGKDTSYPSLVILSNSWTYILIKFIFLFSFNKLSLNYIEKIFNKNTEESQTNLRIQHWQTSSQHNPPGKGRLNKFNGWFPSACSPKDYPNRWWSWRWWSHFCEHFFSLLQTHIELITSFWRPVRERDHRLEESLCWLANKKATSSPGR